MAGCAVRSTCATQDCFAIALRPLARHWHKVAHAPKVGTRLAFKGDTAANHEATVVCSLQLSTYNHRIRTNNNILYLESGQMQRLEWFDLIM